VWECQAGFAPLCSVSLAPFVGLGAAGFESVGVGAGFDYVGVAGEPVDDGGDESGAGGGAWEKIGA